MTPKETAYRAKSYPNYSQSLCLDFGALCLGIECKLPKLADVWFGGRFKLLIPVSGNTVSDQKIG